MYENLKKRYDMNFVTQSQLQQYVSFGKLTQAEYDLIVGDTL